MISSNDIWFHDTMWGRLFAKDGICLFIAFNHKLLIKLWSLIVITLFVMLYLVILTPKFLKLVLPQLDEDHVDVKISS